MNDYVSRPFEEYREYPPDEMQRRVAAFYANIDRRRSVREFSARAVSRELIETALKAASTAPSGANMQPWHFVAVSGADTKRRIREAAEEEEREFYGRRASDEWLDALKPFGTDANKPFLEVAPWLIAIFLKKYSEDEHGAKVKHYYPTESTGIATGILKPRWRSWAIRPGAERSSTSARAPGRSPTSRSTTTSSPSDSASCLSSTRACASGCSTSGRASRTSSSTGVESEPS